MIRHCVFLNFKHDVSTETRTALFEEVASLQSQIAGMREIHFGPNCSPEVGMDKGFSDGFIIDFDDAAARDAYLIHDDHKIVGGKLVAHAKNGVDGILVFDLEMPIENHS